MNQRTLNFELDEALLQNEIIENFCKKFKLKPNVISRDKEGHVLIITITGSPSTDEFYSNKLYCYMLGRNKHSNKIMPFNVGYCLFKYYKNYNLPLYEKYHLPYNLADISTVSVHKAFQNLGIGRIMLQAVENEVLEDDIHTITLSATKFYVPINGEKKNFKFAESEEYFDKNYYFYTSNGYSDNHDELKDISKFSYVRPLKKTKLKKIAIENGLTNIIKRTDKNSSIFSIAKENSFVRKNLGDDTYHPIFNNGYNNIPSEQFSPISLDASRDSTLHLYKVLKAYKLKEAFSPSATYLHKFYNSEEDVNTNIKFSPRCSTPEFKDYVNNLFDKLVEENPDKDLSFETYLKKLTLVEENKEEYEQSL